MPRWSVIEYIRKSPIDYKVMLEKRGKSTDLLEKFLKYDSLYRKTLTELNKKREELNKFSRDKTLAISKRDQLQILKKEIKLLESKYREIKKQYSEILFLLPNLISKDVPDGLTEENNMPLKYFGKPKVWSEDVEIFLHETKSKGFNVEYEEISFRPKGHAELLENVLKLGNTQQASRVAASRFYYLFDEIALIDFALTLYAIDNLTKKGYHLVIPPYLLREKILRSALDFDSFKEMIYKVEKEDLYLIGTAEHPLLALYSGRIIEEDDLPIKLVGWSPCFRKEAGAHGKDTKGIFRVHQFHKVEQFIFSPPDEAESEKLHEELIRNAEELFKGLELPIRTVNVCAGELGDHASKKYDIEVWFPSQAKYREVVSASNCLDWQAFRGNIFYRDKKIGRMKYVYTLNSTGIPTSRTICAILENYQLEDGSVQLPKVLRKYLEPFGVVHTDILLPKNRLL